jgi:ABC-type polar amino acid transport system ATPase subunit
MGDMNMDRIENDSDIIVVNELHKYFVKHHVLKGISLRIQRGSVVSIMGPSGGGKSTFLRCLNRLEEPTAGEIYIDGTEITDPHVNLRRVRQEIGMVFQSYNLFPHLTALQNVALAPVNVKKQNRKKVEKLGMQLLQRVGVHEKADQYPDQLSGGQQQREVLDVMVGLARDGMTMLVVSHEIGFIREASSRVLVLVDGSIIEDGSVDQVFTMPKHKRTKDFLGKIL